jgi:hypothetical protein
MLAGMGQVAAAKAAPSTARPRGLFGNFNPLRFENNGMTGADRLMGIGALLSDLGGGQGNSVAVQQMRQQRIGQEREAAQQEARQAAQQQLMRSLSGGGKGQAVAGGPAGQSAGLPALRDAAPALLAAQFAGVDTGDIANLLDRAGPDLQFVNGVGVDTRDPSNVGQRIGFSGSNVNGTIVDLQDPGNRDRFVPQVGEGQEMLRDMQGNPVVRNIPGYVRAQAEQRGGVVGAEQAAQAPYRFLQVQGPNGEPMTVAVSNMVGGAVVGQSEADRAYAIATAQDRAEREDSAETRGSAAQRMLPSLDEMERLLPDVIAGYAADQRLDVQRGLAAFGNEDATRRVTATQVFQNEARQIVSQIIRAFGANPTEGERRYAEQMAGADVNLSPEALQEGIRLARARAARDAAAAPSARQGQGAPRPRSQAEYNALPSGAVYIDPNGVERRKP